MSDEMSILALSAAAIAFFHTMLGPDHYLPFIAMSRAQGWSLARTATITTLCGAGHVLSAVLLGMVGIALGLAASFTWPGACGGRGGTHLTRTPIPTRTNTSTTMGTRTGTSMSMSMMAAQHG
jgi:hypothetical protein